MPKRSTSIMSGTTPRPDTSTTFGDPSRSTTSLGTMSNTLSRSLSFTPAPTLDSLTLAHILNGETCPPISFPDFAAFVSHKEFTTENLLFVIWFRSYRQRFEALPKETRDAVPIPSARLGDRYSPFKYLDAEVVDGVVGGRDSVDESKVDFQTPLGGNSPKKKRHYKEGDFQPCAWTVDGQSCACGNPATHRHGGSQGKKSWFSRRKSLAILEAGPSMSPYQITPILNPATTHPQLPPAGTTLMSPPEQPMRAEAERAFATFLKKGGSRELGISDELRVFARETLARSTAPNCFLPIFDEIYHTVETQSLPHFLSEAKMNINRPKQLYWYLVGLCDFLLGLLIFILLTLFVPERNFGYRLIRLPVIIFTSFGAMQFYSAFRGFCSQTWGRSARQVRPWELDTLDEDAEAGSGGRQMSEVEGLPLTALTGLGLKGLNRSSVEVGAGTKNEDGDDKVEELDVTLPEGVHPLGELVGVSPTETAFADDSSPGRTAYKFGSSSPFSPSSEKWTPRHERTSSGESGDDELTEVQLRQLAIRRDTIKVPSSDLAFPIADSLPVSPITPHSSAPLFAASPPSSGGFSADISPFAQSTPVTRTAPAIRGHVTPSTSPRVSIDAKAKRHSASQSMMTQHRIPMADLSTLLVKFRRAEPLDPQSYRAGEDDRERSMRIFGPERLIEDPRVKQLMSRIVKEILVVGVIMGVITVVLCFAVPMRLS